MSTAPSNTEIVRSLGMEDQLVGTTVLSPLDTAKVGGWTSVDCNAVDGLEPDHIFLNVCGAGRNVSPDTVLERKDWQNIEAVSNGNVAVLDDSVLNQPSPRLLEGVRSMATEI